jgi:hypothetical protein
MASNLETIGFSYQAHIGEEATSFTVGVWESTNFTLKGIIRSAIVSSIGETRWSERSGHLPNPGIVEHIVSGVNPEQI